MLLRTRTIYKDALLCLTMALLLLAGASAQSGSGKAAITGRVADESGAAIPNADLTLTNTQTGEKRVLKSDSVGLYNFPALLVGSYSLTADSPNFGQASITNVELTVGQTAELDVIMKPAQVSNTIDVTGNEDLVHATETSNSTVIGEQAVRDLPTRGRNFTDFALLTPGISQEIDRFGLVVNGQRSGNGNISVDGVDFNDPLQNGQRGGPVAVNFFPQVMVREFQVVRTGATAEVGRTNAGFVNVVTRSGTNRIHGEGFYTNRNPWLTWPDALNDPEATNNQNQFGFGMGGPIIKDKLFFFAGVEKTLFEVPFFVRIGSNCPTAGYYDPNPGPYTGTTYNGPASFSVDQGCAQGAPGAGTVPLPTAYAALETNSYGLNNPLVSSGRLDYQLSPRNTAMLQYMSTFVNNVAYGVSGLTQAAVSNNTTYAQQSQALIIGLTTAISSNRTNDLHAQWVYDNRLQTPNTPGAAEIDIGDFINIGGTATGTYIYRAIREEAVDNFSLLVGHHSLRFGVDINFEPETQQREFYPNGLWTVDTFADYLAVLPVSQGGGGSTPAAVNAGSAGCGSETNACPFQFQQSLPYMAGVNPEYRAMQREFGGYAEDNFRALKNLTIKMGLRYDVQLEPAAPANPAVAGTGVDPSDVTMIQPRLGIAWDAYGTGKTVIRVSSGLFDARTPGYILQHDFTDNGAQLATLNSNYNQNILSTVPLYGSYGSLAGVPSASASNILNDVYTNDPNFRNPRSLQVAASVEQQLTKRLAFFLGATQQETWKLQHRLDTNLFQPMIDPATLYPRFPTVNPVTHVACAYGGVTVPCRPNSSIAGLHTNFSTGHSDYRSLVAQLRGNFTSRLSGILNYTWASVRDDDSNERDADRELALDPLCTACYNRGYSQQDIRHQFNLNAIYRLPSAGRDSSMVRHLTERIIFTSSFIARTALPYTAVTSGSKQGDLNNDGNTKNDRPILCSPVAFTVCQVSSTQFNAYKGGAEVGTVVGRNTFRQDGFLNWDMRLIKGIRIRNEGELQFSAECLNCSRSSNLNLGGNATSKFTHAQSTMNPLTGYYYSGNSAGKMTTAYDTFRSGGPRQIQLGARYRF